MLSLKQEKDVEMLGAECGKNGEELSQTTQISAAKHSFDIVDEREFDTPSNNNGVRRLIPVRKILIYDLGNEKVDAMVPTVQQAKNILRIDNWFYNQQFEPDFTISLTLGQLGLADGFREEVELAKFWKIFIDYENAGEGQKELKSLFDSDNHTKPNCTLVMRKKTPDELDPQANKVKVEPPQDEEMKNQISSHSQSSSDDNLSSSNRSDSAESNSSSQSSRKSSAKQAKKKKNLKQLIVKKTSTMAQQQQIQSQQVVKSTKLGRVKNSKQVIIDDSSQSRHNRDSSEEWLRNLNTSSHKTVGSIVQKVPKTTQILTQKSNAVQQRQSQQMGEVTMSKCGQFKKYKNIKNIPYIACEKAVQILASDKEKLHTDLQSMRKGIIEQLNKISKYPTMKYRIVATPKYVTIKCQYCKTFQYWYQNDKEMTTQEISKLTTKNSDELLSALEGRTINMKFYRSINQNHDLEKHSDVQFQ